MRLEDALFFVVFNADGLPGAGFYDICCQAVEVGADIVSVRSDAGKPEMSYIEAAAKACRDKDALYFAWDDPATVERVGAAGVHFGNADASIGNARAIAGVNSIVGFSTGNVEEATLAAEVGADYIVHTEGMMCPAVFEQMRGAGLSHLYAGGIHSIEEAGSIVEDGVFRLCIEINNEEEATPEVIAEYSRLLGRIV